MESDISCARTHLRFFLDYALSCLAARQVSSSCFTRIKGNICSVFHDFLGGLHIQSLPFLHHIFHDMFKKTYADNHLVQTFLQRTNPWLVVWNMTGLFSPSYWECHHPN